MAIWLNSEQLARAMKRSLSTAKDAIKAGSYKGKPLIVRQEKITQGKGRPSYLVLWDTDTNQPAIQPEEVQFETLKEEKKIESIDSQNLRTLTETVITTTAELCGGIQPSLGFDSTPTTGDESVRDINQGIRAISRDVSRPHCEIEQTETEDNLPDGRDSTECSNNSNVERDGENEEANKKIKETTDLATTGNHHEHEHPDTLESIPAISVITTDTAVNTPAPDYGRSTRLTPTTEGKPITLSCSLLALAELAELSGERKAANGLQDADRLTAVSDTSQASVVMNGVDTETGEVVHPESFTCQLDYIERLIKQKGLIKQCRSTMMSRYFASIVPAPELMDAWQDLTNNTQRKKFAQQHNLIGTIPARLATKEPKKLRGRKSTVTFEIVSFIGRELLARTDVKNLAKFTPVRERNAERIIEWVKTEFNQEISAAQVRAVIKKNNFQCFLEPIAEEQGGSDKQQAGSWPRMPVCEIWLMDGVVPSKFYIRDAKGTGWTHITCIGIEDVGSRLMLGFKEYYSESGVASVHLFKEVFTNNTFKRGTSEKAISPTLRPDQGSGFVSSMDGCAYAIGELYAQKHHFLIDYKPAKAGTPTDKAHLESSWKYVHGKYINMVREVFGSRIHSKSGWVKNHKTNKTVWATYFDITLEELRASGIAEQFRNDINNKRRNFKEDNADIKFRPIDRWQRFLCNAGDDDPISPPPAGSTFIGTAEELIKLDIFGYPKLTGYSVRHQAGGFIVTYKTRKYVVQTGHSFSKVHSTEVRISVLPSGDLALFTEKEKSDLGAEFLCLATLGAVGATGENTDKYHAARQRKDQKLKDTVTKITQASLEDLMLAEFEKHAITPYQPTVKKLIEQGLGLELMQSIITSNAALSQPSDGSEVSKTTRFKHFHMGALRALQTTTTATVKRGVL